MIDFWIVRKGKDPWKVAPEIGEVISEHPDNKKCLFCGDGHEIGAVIAFRQRKSPYCQRLTLLGPTPNSWATRCCAMPSVPSVARNSVVAA
jgi:hypothetical protein